MHIKKIIDLRNKQQLEEFPTITYIEISKDIKTRLLQRKKNHQL